MFASTDMGQTWNQSFLFDCWINRIRQLDNGLLLVSGWKDQFAPDGSTTSYFLLASLDNGLTWRALSADRFITSFARGAANTLFVGVHGGGVLRSEDGGLAWSPVNSGLQENIGGYLNLYVWDILDASDGLVFAATSGGAVRSTDNGNSWSRIGPGQLAVRRLFRSDQKTLLAACEGGIYRTSDLGASWTLVCSTTYAHEFARNSRGTIIAVSEEGVFASPDAGLSWSRLSMSPTQSLTVVITRSNTWVLATDNNKVFRSTDDGASWTESQTGFNNSYVQSICVTRSSLVAIADGALMRSTDGGTHWIQQGALTNLSKLVSVGLDTVYAIADGLYRSADEGLSWSRVEVPFGQSYPTYIAVTRNGHLFVGAATNVVYRSLDAGASWTVIAPQPAVDRVFLLAANENGLLVVGNDDYALRVSSDNGTNWVSNYMDHMNNSIAVNQRGDIFVGDLNGAVVRSTDKGVTWEKYAITGLYANNVRVLTPLGENEIIAGLYYGGVFRSTDKGQTWIAMNDGLLNKNITSIAVAADGFLYLATVGGGVFRSIGRF
jgi:photosystem II stability/assembly factor-like uncharacterized protein